MAIYSATRSACRTESNQFVTYFGGSWSGRELHCHIQSLSPSLSSFSFCKCEDVKMLSRVQGERVRGLPCDFSYSGSLTRQNMTYCAPDVSVKRSKMDTKHTITTVNLQEHETVAKKIFFQVYQNKENTQKTRRAKIFTQQRLKTKTSGGDRRKFCCFAV
jgi:hypothetical protein